MQLGTLFVAYESHSTRDLNLRFEFTKRTERDAQESRKLKIGRPSSLALGNV